MKLDRFLRDPEFSGNRFIGAACQDRLKNLCFTVLGTFSAGAVLLTLTQMLSFVEKRVGSETGTILFAWLFLLSREKHARIQKLLEQRRARLAE